MTRIEYITEHTEDSPSNTAKLYRCNITGMLIGDWEDVDSHIRWMNKQKKYEKID